MKFVLEKISRTTGGEPMMSKLLFLYFRYTVRAVISYLILFDWDKTGNINTYYFLP